MGPEELLLVAAEWPDQIGAIDPPTAQRLAGGLVFYAAFALIGLLATGAVPATAGGDAAASVDAQSDARADAASGVLHTLPSRLRPVTVLTLGFYFIGMMGCEINTVTTLSRELHLRALRLAIQPATLAP